MDTTVCLSLGRLLLLPPLLWTLSVSLQDLAHLAYLTDSTIATHVQVPFLGIRLVALFGSFLRHLFDSCMPHLCSLDRVAIQPILQLRAPKFGRFHFGFTSCSISVSAVSESVIRVLPDRYLVLD